MSEPGSEQSLTSSERRKSYYQAVGVEAQLITSTASSQAGHKSTRTKTLENIRRLQDRLQAKIKELNTARSKFPYKTGSEVDAKISSLEKQVESGKLSLVEERKTLNEISS